MMLLVLDSIQIAGFEAQLFKFDNVLSHEHLNKPMEPRKD
jgi:hypothetical protein